jgi:hypothetical protein
MPLCFTPFNPHAKFYFIGKLRSNLCRPQTKAILWYTHSWRLKTQIDSTSLSFKISRDAGHGPLLTHAHLVHNGEKCPKRSNHKKDLGKNPHWSGAKARFSIHHPFFPKAPHFP